MTRTPIDPSDAPAAPPVAAAPEAGSPFTKAKFEALLLICERCAERGSGPSKRKAEEIRTGFRKALGSQRTRWRIVQTSCLGLCPKKAVAVAAATAGAPPLLAAVRRGSELRAVADRLADLGKTR